MTQLSGASVLILGASGGLGSRLATEAAQRGAIVTLVGRDQARLDSVPVDGVRLAIDLRDPGACRTAVATAVDAAGKVDVVINAVGLVAFGPVAELGLDTLEELFLTNTFVPVFAAQAALQAMAAGGTIVNISGVIAEQNLPGMAAYGASKAAVKAFDEALAREARRAKIAVLDARPGHTETGLATRAIAGTAPAFPDGLDPAHVASVILDAVESGAKDLPSTAF
jgi:cyclic-di-GMP-binding biofilm dispersal mediator protein